jgi:hypothetical protein
MNSMYDPDPRRHFTLEILRQSGDQSCVNASISIVKKLNELYRYFEPALFSGEVFVFIHLSNESVFDSADGVPIYDPNVLLHRRDGVLAIQIFEDGRLTMWDKADEGKLRTDPNIVTYIFRENEESFIARTFEINITICPFGSRFATQYLDLVQALNRYKVSMVFRSTCPLLTPAWFDDKLIFFLGGGPNRPESHLQKSLHHFLTIVLNVLRGARLVLREFNVVDENGRPVDIAIYWGEANRMALIEIKWLGKSKHPDGTLSTTYTNSHVNRGLLQLKGYFDTARTNSPETIIQAYLVMIDGRRNNTNEDTQTVSFADGMHFESVELVVAEDRQYYNDQPGFNPPIRMFAAPIIG